MKKICLLFLLFGITVLAIDFSKPVLCLQSDYDKKGFDFYKCKDVSLDNEGNIYLLDNGNSRILKYDAKGNFLLSIGEVGKGPANFYDPDSMELVGDSIWVTDTRNNVIKIIKNDKIVEVFKINEMVLPRNICLVGNKIFISAGLHNPNDKSIAVFNKDMQLVKRISAGISVKGIDNKVLSLWNRAKFCSSNDKKSLYVCFPFYPIIKQFNEDGELLSIYKMNKFYKFYMDNNYKAPAGYGATAFSSGPSGTFFIAVCDNEKKICGKLIQLNSKLNKIVATKEFNNQHIWYINFFKKQNKFVIITSEDEVLFYDTSR
jgi:hypothetical protein